MNVCVPLPFESRDASTLFGVATDGVTGTAGRSVAVSAPTTRSLRKIMLLDYRQRPLGGRGPPVRLL